MGRAAPGNALRVCDDDGGELPSGTTGTVEVSGPHVAAGYWRNQGAWLERFRDGWFQTDDAGWLDGEGYLHFVGRRDDLINCGGEKLSPISIEQRLDKHLALSTFCICSITDPDGIFGEVPVLCIEGEMPDGFDWPALRAALAGDLAPSETPRRVVSLPAFPRTGNNKIQRRALRRMIEAGECTAH